MRNKWKNRGVSGRRKRGRGERGWGVSATAAMASSRDTVVFSRKNMFRIYKTVLNSRKNMFHVYKTISGEKLFAFVAIGKRCINDLCCNVGYSSLG